MSFKYQFNETTNTLTISVKGYFNYAVVDDFRDLYNVIKAPEYIDIDLAETEMIDSSGLGCLLFMKKFYGTKKQATRIQNCNAILTRIFALAQFCKMFTIDTSNVIEPVEDQTKIQATDVQPETVAEKGFRSLL